MIEVLMALRTIIGELIKALDRGSTEDYEGLTASQFMLYCCYEEGKDVFCEIGVRNASPSQLRCLTQLPLVATFSCLRLFSCWVDEGFYDYDATPFPFKMHLSEEDQFALKQLSHKWTGTKSNLVKELQQLIDALKQSEQDIVGQNEAINVRFTK